MPRIEDSALDCSAYLYPDAASAARGDHLGDTSFFVGRPASQLDGLITTWIVTNKHVVESGASVVRLNRRDGGLDIIEIDDRDWFFHPEGDDLAVSPIRFDRSCYSVTHLLIDRLITKEIIEKYAVGPGDPVYVIGRFINQEGRQRNTPTVRFGQIAQMPTEKINSRVIAQESFLVEEKSLGGYSGAPVFVFLEQQYRRPIKHPGVFESGHWLLGVNWCMIPSWQPVCDGSGRPLSSGIQVPMNTGMAGVVPA